MQRKVVRGPWALAICFALLGTRCYAATGTLRIVSWNIEDDINGATTPLPGLNTVLQGIGNETVGSDPAQPLDILGLEETTSNSTTVAPIVADLNGDYPGANYQMSTYQATQDGSNNDGNGPNALVYNANKLTLLASVGVVTPTGSNGVDRQPVRYEFQPVGDTGSNGIFYVYVSHAKSGSSSSDLADQNDEATIIRNDEATNLPANASVLYTGDLNADPNESGVTQFNTYEKATATNTNTNQTVTQGAANDPANASTATQYLSESSTDLRYRDDYHLMTANVQGGTGAINYVAGSFHYLGNNGTTAANGNVDSPSTTGGSNTALAYMTTAAGYSTTQSQVLSALTTASDHLPAIADYTYTTPEPGSCSLAAAALAFAMARRPRRLIPSA